MLTTPSCRSPPPGAHELTRAKAIQALRDLDRAGRPVTFDAVAAPPAVSRSWLYTQPDIRDRDRAAARGQPSRAPGPTSPPASAPPTHPCCGG